MSSIIINNLKNIENYSYLELGLGSGTNFNAICCKDKISVDYSTSEATFQLTTDEYFAQLAPDVKFDITFIDANHDYDYVVRDFNNSIDRTNHWILMHDMIPPDEAASVSCYCGDSYKVLYHMLKYTNFTIYPMSTNFGFTLVKLPASKIELSDETKNLPYAEFRAFMADKKLYSDSEIIELLQNS